MDEIYTTDMLDGDANGRDYEIPFGAIRSIERESSRAARVTLNSGEEIVLDGSNDVDRRNRGISVSDPDLGQVLVEWDAFARVELHGTAGACVALVVVLPLVHGEIVVPTGPTPWLVLVTFGALTIALAQFLFFDALGRLEASAVSVATAAEPAVAALLATVLLSQGLDTPG